MALPRKKPRIRTKPADPDKVVSPGHCRWVRTKFDCAVADKTRPLEVPKHQPCNGRIDPHHVKTRGAGGDDSQVVPLCRAHHNQLDSPWCSQPEFEALYGVNLYAMAFDLWQADTYHRGQWIRKQKEVADG